jgi:hypothetical protein
MKPKTLELRIPSIPVEAMVTTPIIYSIVMCWFQSVAMFLVLATCVGVAMVCVVIHQIFDMYRNHYTERAGIYYVCIAPYLSIWPSRMQKQVQSLMDGSLSERSLRHWKKHGVYLDDTKPETDTGQ